MLTAPDCWAQVVRPNATEKKVSTARTSVKTVERCPVQGLEGDVAGLVADRVGVDLGGAQIVEEAQREVVADHGERTGVMGVQHHARAAGVDDVLEATGWELRVSDDVRETPPPSGDELTTLRSLRTKGQS